MADESKTIAELNAGNTLTGAELVPLWQNDQTIQVPISEIANLGEGGLKKVIVPVTTDDLLQIGTTPKVLIPAAGANIYIVPINIMVVYQFDTAPYATSATLRAKFNGTAASDYIFECGDISAVANWAHASTNVGAQSSGVRYLQNTAVELTTSDGVDPTAGAGALTVYVTYVEHDTSGGGGPYF